MLILMNGISNSMSCNKEDRRKKGVDFSAKKVEKSDMGGRPRGHDVSLDDLFKDEVFCLE